MEQITRRASVEALKKQAYEANRWSSFDPERAGEVLLNCCEQELSEFLSKIVQMCQPCGDRPGQVPNSEEPQVSGVGALSP